MTIQFSAHMDKQIAMIASSTFHPHFGLPCADIPSPQAQFWWQLVVRVDLTAAPGCSCAAVLLVSHESDSDSISGRSSRYHYIGLWL